MKIIQKLKWLRSTCLYQELQAYKRSKEGIAAIEFAIVAPIMIVMYIGLAELSIAIAEDRRVSHAANVAGDLTTQLSSVSSGNMSDIMNAVLLVLDLPASEYPKVRMEINSYSKDASGALITDGTAVLNGPFGSAYNASAIDSRILNDTSGVVVARVSYDYTIRLMNFSSTNDSVGEINRGVNNITLEETFLLKPRQSARVVYADASGNSDFTCNHSASGPSC